MGRQSEPLHTTTVVLDPALRASGTQLAEARFISFDGNYAEPATGGVKDAVGVSEAKSYQGSIPVRVAYTAVLEMAEAVAAAGFIKPAADGTGRGAAGTPTDYGARIKSGTQGANADDFVEVIVYPHVHP